MQTVINNNPSRNILSTRREKEEERERERERAMVSAMTKRAILIFGKGFCSVLKECKNIYICMKKKTTTRLHYVL